MFQECGSPCYMAPELINRLGYREKADVFSVGSVFFNLLSKRFLFNGRDNDELIERNRVCSISRLPWYI